MTGAIRVLYVDDESGLLEIGKLFLEESGEFSVTTIESTPAALELLKTEKFDAIISDYQMPEMNGIQFLVEVRAQFGKIPFILFTGKGREEVVIQAINNGADFYLQKGGDFGAQYAELSHKIKSAALRKKAEDALRESERTFRVHIENSFDIIFTLDSEGRFIFISPAWERHFSIPVSDALGKSFGPFVHEDDIAPLFEYLKRVLITGHSEASPAYRVRHADGRWLWFVANGTPYVNTKGELQFIGVGRDITERKYAEEALRLSEEKYHGIFDESIAAVYVFDNKKNFIDSNQAGLDLLGYSREELLHMSIPDVDVDPIIVLPAHEELLSGGRLINYEHRLRRKDGNIITVLNNSRPLTDSHGNIAGMLSTLIDITERKEAEEALKESDSFNRGLVESLPDYIAIYGPDGNILHVNSASARVLGYSEEKIVGTSVLSYVAEESRGEVTSRITDRLEGGEIPTYEIDILTHDGLRRSVILKGTQIHYGETPATLLVLTDITDRKRTEESLRENEERYKYISEMTTDFVFSCIKSEGGLYSIDWLAGAVERITEYTIDELLAMGCWRSLVHPDDSSVFDENITNLPEGTSRTCTLRIRTKSGMQRWLAVNTIQVSTKDSSLSNRIFGGCRDITDRKLKEEALQESEERFRLITDTIDEAFWMADVEIGKIFYVSPSFERIWGCSRESLYENPRSFLDAIHLEDRERVLADLEIEKTGQPFDHEYRIIRPDGNIKYIWDRGFPIRHKNGQVSTYAGVAMDITKRKMAEEVLRESEQKYWSILKASPDDICITDLEGVINMVSPAALTMFGFEREEEILGQNIVSFIVPEDRDRAAKNLGMMLKGIFPGPGEYRAIHSEGSTFDIEVNGEFVRNQSGQPSSIVFIARDITKRRKTEEAIKIANKKLNLLSGITRHDIKNKVITIQGFLRFVRNSKDIDAIQPFLDKIHESTKAIEHQIDFMKDYQDLGVHSPKWLNLSNMIISGSKPAISVTDETGTLQIFADPLFEKVLHNLTDNTIRHGETATKVNVSVVIDKENIRIIWTDNGVGVPVDKKEMIFQKGYGKNTGFGLFLIREILAITGLTIQETGEPGKGARFEITVPNGKWRYENESS